MDINKEQLLDDCYEVCEAFLTQPINESVPTEFLFKQAASRIISFNAYGPNKPSSHQALQDAWDYYTDAQRQVLKDANHPFWQAVEELTQQNSDNQD